MPILETPAWRSEGGRLRRQAGRVMGYCVNDCAKRGYARLRRRAWYTQRSVVAYAHRLARLRDIANDRTFTLPAASYRRMPFLYNSPVAS